MHRGWLVAFLTVGLVLTWPSAAEADGHAGVTTSASHLKVGLFDMPPFYSKDNNGRPTGELINTLAQVMSELDLSWEPRFGTPPEILKGLVNGDLDLLMVIHHPMLKFNAIYGQVPVARMELVAFHTPAKVPAASLTDLQGQRVALLRGYGYGGLVGQLMAPDSGLELEIAEGHHEAFRWLSEGKVDYVLNYRRPGEQAIEQLNLQEIQGNTLQTIEVYFVVSDKLAHGQQLLGRMDQSLKSLLQ